MDAVENLPYYVNLCFYDMHTEFYYQSSDYKEIKNIKGFDYTHPLKEGIELDIRGRKVIVIEVHVWFMDIMKDRSKGLVHSVYGEDKPYILQIDVWTKDII